MFKRLGAKPSFSLNLYTFTINLKAKWTSKVQTSLITWSWVYSWVCSMDLDLAAAALDSISWSLLLSLPSSSFHAASPWPSELSNLNIALAGRAVAEARCADGEVHLPPLEPTPVEMHNSQALLTKATCLNGGHCALSFPAPLLKIRQMIYSFSSYRNQCK